MSYGMSAALQEAVYAQLSGDAAVAAEVGTAIYDAVPAGDVPELYVSLGPEDVRERCDKTGGGAEHRLIVSVVTRQPGFQGAKRAAATVTDALDGADLTLSRGRLVALWFERARARRVSKGDVRRIDLTFRARVEDD
ncbi:MAG: DUF3168 domain-containing protein [Pseudomonadota bacterium]